MANSLESGLLNSSAPVLKMSGIIKDFPGTRALDGVELQVYPGQVVALMGENGAGKSTLMKILSGVWGDGTFEGEFEVQGRLAKFVDTRDAHAAGVAMIHQELAVFNELTVSEHLELDQLSSWIDWDALHERVQVFLDGLGLGLKARARVGDLPVGGRQLVEIARALYRDAKVIVFDEPTSALTESEVQRLYSIIDQLKKEGRAIVYITHRMDEVFRLADRMVVLRDGKYVGTLERGPREQVEPKLITMMVGREIKDVYPPLNTKVGEVALSVRGLKMRNPKGRERLKGVDFEVKKGEVLGLAGLLGAGRSDIFEALFGLFHPSGTRGDGYLLSGEAILSGEGRGSKILNRPIDAIGARMAFVSEDRKGNGLILNQSILSNMSLVSLARGVGPVGREFFLNPLEERKQAAHLSAELKLKHSSLDQNVGELSGGNQQKVVLAKWLMTEPQVLFLDEPTRGIDVGAKSEIYHWIQRLAAQGMAVIVASSEMPELLGLCHRILVLREGLVAAELSGPTANQEQIMRAASL